MKILITALLLLVGMSLAVCWAEQIDPSKPLYQMDYGIMPPGNMWFGGSWSTREHKRPETLEEQQLRIKLDNMAIAASKGRRLMSHGISAIVLGTMLFFYLNQFHLQWIGLGVAGFGVWRFATGLIEIKIAENWQVVTGALFVGIIITITGAILWNSGVNLGKVWQWVKRKRGSKKNGPAQM